MKHVFNILAAAVLMYSMNGSLAAKDRSDADRSAAIKRGNYLVRIAGCNDCHTEGYAQRGGNADEAAWLTGSRVGFEGPWGTTYPSNLRLLVSELTREQWLFHARKPARPPMPWFSLRDMTDEDLTAIYFFIRALGPAGAAAPAYESSKPTQQASTLKRWPCRVIHTDQRVLFDQGDCDEIPTSAN